MLSWTVPFISQVYANLGAVIEIRTILFFNFLEERKTSKIRQFDTNNCVIIIIEKALSLNKWGQLHESHLTIPCCLRQSPLLKYI